MNGLKILQTTQDLYQKISAPETFTAGHSIGIIAVDLIYPKLPGNVANATTYAYPVLYKKVSFDIEQLFKGESQIKNQIIEAAKELEKEGVSAIIGACGYFAHFQKEVAQAVDVPVFLSSLCQIPTIKLSLKPTQKIAILAASAENITRELLLKVGANLEDCIVKDVGSLESFAPIRFGKTELDNGQLTKDLANEVSELVASHPEIGAILLECSDLPPYAYEIQRVTKLPVFDFITMIDWVQHAVVQRRYFGYL